MLAAPARAAITYEKGPNSTRPSIWIANDDGSAPRKLARGDFPVISPDGTAVVFMTRPARTNPGLGIVSSAGGAARNLGKNLQAGVVWSPDSKSVAAILGQTLGSQRLVLIDVATGRQKVLATGALFGLSFSPDGTRIAYGRAPSARSLFPRTDVFTVPVTGGTPTQLTHDHASSNPVWGPTLIAYTHTVKAKRREDNPKTNVFLMNPDGSGQRQLTHQHAPFLLSGPSPLAWSADSTKLLAEFGGQDTSYGEGVDVATGKVHTFSHVKAVEFGFVAGGISRDGSKVIGATGGFDPGSHHDVEVIPWAGGKPKLIARNAFAPTWND